ncbi:MAG: hypothetical protein CL678_04460 [Bdellovibrionaceae bacterium]|nr:hypothetical protein [Pseudobdellovibrionaceae bacterium]|tara:strand:- start:5024 stop:5527 length:504 start_codon:yes stop_codon:yes gene_type:complete
MIRIFVCSFTFFISCSSFAIPARFIQVEPDLFRGGALEETIDFEELKSFGVKTILNLRWNPWLNKKEQEKASEMGFEWFSEPMIIIKTPSHKQLSRIYEVMTNPGMRPLYVHCKHGKDRTGLAFGLYRVHHDQWRPIMAYREMLKIGFSQWLIPLKRAFWKHARSDF